jgi:hypothetical protein
MTCRQKDPRRILTNKERHELQRLSRAQAEPVALAARAKALLAVADGQRFTDAAQTAGRWSGDTVAQLVARFNRDGLATLEPGHGGGQPKRHSVNEQERHPQVGTRREVRRAPDRDNDGLVRPA